MLALTYCISFLGEGPGKVRPGQNFSKLGPSWLYVGTSVALGCFFSLLGASYALFEHFWHALAVFLASWSALGSILEAPKLYFSTFFRTIAVVLLNKCINCCIKPKLAFASAFRSPLQRGGTCAAHPPPPEGSAERARHLSFHIPICLPLRPAFRIRLQIPSSKAFPPSFCSFPRTRTDRRASSAICS